MTDLSTTKKKLPFKPTALRGARPKPTPSSSGSTDHDAPNSSGGRVEEDELALFRRAKEMAPIVEADRERRRRRQEQKRRAREQEEQAEARRREAEAEAASKRALEEEEDGDATTPTASGIMATQEGEDTIDLATPPPSKRSRRSDAGLDSFDSVVSESPSRGARSMGPDRSVEPPLSFNTRSRRSAMPAGSQVILLDSDSEPETTTPAAAPVDTIDHAATIDLDLDIPKDDNDDDDDDEFAEYVRKAQEQRDAHIQQRALAAARSPTSHDLSLSPPPPPPTKQIIGVVITSEIPDALPFMARVCFDRPMRVVRDSWAAFQRTRGTALDGGVLPRDDDAVLTWRRKKVYMASTLLSLGIRPDPHVVGAAAAAALPDGGSDGFNDDRTRIHMQAWTPELFAQMEREEERRHRRDSEEVEEDEEEPVREEEPTIRVMLKTRGGEPVKLKVRMGTTTETLVAAFCAQRQGDVPEGADVGLWFDGMRLAEGATVEDADIDDMDTIEVHVKQ